MKKKYSIGRLQKQFVIFTVIILIVLQFTFQISNGVVRTAIEENSSSSSENVLLQLYDRLDEMVTDTEAMSSVLVYNPTVVSYIRGRAEERPALQEDMLSVLGNFLQMTQGQVQGIGIYDAQKMLLMTYGRSSYFSKELEGTIDKTTYSDVTVSEYGEKNYTITIPIYDLESYDYKKFIGVCVLQMSTEKIEKILDEYVVIGKSEVVVTDRTSRVLSYRGWEESVPDFYTLKEPNENFFVWEMQIATSGWKLLSRVSTENVQLYMNEIQIINRITYAIVVVLIVVFLLYCYRYIIKPILKLSGFVKKHVENPDKRIALNINNEIQDLADNLNVMMDEKERLNDQHKDMQKRMYEMEIAQKQAEIMAYRSQINPHFLYNTLECIRSMAYYYKVQGIVDITMALSNMFRYSIKGKEVVKIQEELKHIQEYATIISYRFMKRITVEIDVEEQLSEIQIVKFLLQPIVENAVFHGLEQCSRKGVVRIHIFEKDESHIKICIEDNGHGIEETKLKEIRESFDKEGSEVWNAKEKSSIGLTNIYNRLKLVYGEDVVFEIESKIDEGTVVTLVLPKL